MLNRSAFLAVSKKVFKQSAIAKSSAIPPFFSGGSGSSTTGSDKASSMSSVLATPPSTTINAPTSTNSGFPASNSTTANTNASLIAPAPAVGGLAKFFRVRTSAAPNPARKRSPFSFRGVLSSKKVKKMAPKATGGKKTVKKPTTRKAKPPKKVLKPKKASSKVKKMAKKITKRKPTNGKKKTTRRKKAGRK